MEAEGLELAGPGQNIFVRVDWCWWERRAGTCIIGINGGVGRGRGVAVSGGRGYGAGSFLLGGW